MLNFTLRIKPIAVRGSVAFKLHTVHHTPNGDTKIKLMDTCMTSKVADELVAVLVEGCVVRGTTLTIERVPELATSPI